MNINIRLQNEIKAPSVPKKKLIEHWINETIKLIPNKISATQNELTIRVVDPTESAELNEYYRGKQGPTNVLSFPDTPLPGLKSKSLGDLAICSKKVIEEAKEQDKTIRAHWAHLVIHGFLHLLGYDHICEIDAKTMEELEIKILTTLGFPNPYT